MYLIKPLPFKCSFSYISGVHQGSIVGSLFFNVYMNDIGAKLQIDYHLYAERYTDDLKFQKIIKNLSDRMDFQKALEEMQT